LVVGHRDFSRRPPLGYCQGCELKARSLDPLALYGDCGLLAASRRSCRTRVLAYWLMSEYVHLLLVPADSGSWFPIGNESLEQLEQSNKD
jgi:hypothetical protein